MKSKLDIIIPIALDNDWPTKEELISDIVEQHEQYGFTRFALNFPGVGWRSIGYPPKEFVLQQAALFREVKKAVKPRGIECGWWIGLTFKSGKTEGFQSMVKADGSEHPFANCPLDDAFKKRFAEDVADFSAVAEPAFIITEDDFSLSAAMGCYCDRHIQEFNKRYNAAFDRETLVKTLAERTPEALQVIRQWRELAKDSQVAFAAAMREALDEKHPEIPMGYMQAFFADKDGECTYEIARAMAGDRHVPFSRLYGASYSGIISREIPQLLFHMLYSKQHITEEFAHYMEADTFPHTRFFSAGCQVMAACAVAFSYGMDGAILIDRQLLDGANEETAYGKAYAKERARFEALHQAVKHCHLKGVNVEYQPFFNALDDDDYLPWSPWTQPVGRFGIPYVTTKSEAVFWDDKKARYADDADIRLALSKTLFIDSEAAKILCDRGYGEYIGVEIGEDTKQGRLQWDLTAREVITDEYVGALRGRNMTAPWMLAPKGNGKLSHMTVTNPDCRVITELYNGKRERITPAMTLLHNALGGNVIVMGLTVQGNGSQALFNYRRKHLFQALIAECCDKYCLVKDAPDVMIVENVADDDSCGFRELLTIVNLCEDPLDELVLHLPPHLRDLKALQMMDRNGEWQPVEYRRTSDGVAVAVTVDYCSPLYLMIR